MAKGSADLRVRRCPTCGTSAGSGSKTRPPYVPLVPGHVCDPHCTATCLEDGNFWIIGSPVRTELIRKVGGFRDGLPIYEDWDLWLRCYRAGASVEVIEEATYVAYARPNSRNRAMSMDEKNRWHRVIANA